MNEKIEVLKGRVRYYFSKYKESEGDLFKKEKYYWIATGLMEAIWIDFGFEVAQEINSELDWEITLPI